MVSVPDIGLSGPGSSTGRGHCVVFLGTTLYSHRVSQPLGPYADFAFTSEEEGIPFNCTKRAIKML